MRSTATERRPEGRSPVAVVEAIYRLDGDIASWLERVTSALAAHEAQDIYYAGLQLSGTQRPLIEVTSDERAREVVASFQSVAAREPRWTETFFQPVTVSGSFVALLEQHGQDPRELIEALGRSGAHDVNGCMSYDTFGWHVHCALPRLVPTKTRTRYADWMRLGVHLGTGLRLRRHVARALGDDAILSSSGELVHAPSDVDDIDASRATLEHAAKTMLAARNEARAHDDALSLWSALVDGRWTLCDRVERDGKRFIVAMRNEVAVTHPRQLTTREASVVHWAARGAALKEIAYAFGIAAPTVATHLERAMRKLAVANRSELTVLWRPLEETPAAETIVVAPDRARAVALDEVAVAALTVAEREVVRAVADGHDDDTIATLRGTARSTVRNQLASIFRKLGVGSRVELVARVLAPAPKRDEVPTPS